MSRRDIVVIGGSAGSIGVLQEMLSGLPPSFPAAIFVVVHLSPQHPSMLAKILAKSCPLPVSAAGQGELVEAGHVYVAPPDHHMLLEDHSILLSRGPKENFCRPAIDPLFRSAAKAYGPRVMAVILSGNGRDGTAGSIMVKEFGGVTLIQEPLEAPSASMPVSVISRDSPDYVLPVSLIASQLIRLSNGEVKAKGYGDGRN